MNSQSYVILAKNLEGKISYVKLEGEIWIFTAVDISSITDMLPDEFNYFTGLVLLRTLISLTDRSLTDVYSNSVPTDVNRFIENWKMGTRSTERNKYRFSLLKETPDERIFLTFFFRQNGLGKAISRINYDSQLREKFFRAFDEFDEFGELDESEDTLYRYNLTSSAEQNSRLVESN